MASLCTWSDRRAEVHDSSCMSGVRQLAGSDRSTYSWVDHAAENPDRGSMLPAGMHVHSNVYIAGMFLCVRMHNSVRVADSLI